MKINFRKDVDPWCPDRKILAADGTHVGISLKQMKITPVDQATCADQKCTFHRRFDRVFLFYCKDIPNEDVRAARRHLMLLAKGDQHGLSPEQKAFFRTRSFLNAVHMISVAIECFSSFVLLPTHLVLPKVLLEFSKFLLAMHQFQLCCPCATAM